MIEAPLPITNTEEFLTEQFYWWEMRGRGWLMWDYPVMLEPPFEPFLLHGVPTLAAASIDDGRRPSLFERFFKRLRGPGALPAAPDVPPGVLTPGRWHAPLPDPDELHEALTEFRVGLPREYAMKKESADQVLLSLSAACNPLAFEVMGLPEKIAVHLVAHASDQALVKQQVEAYFPQIALVQAPETLHQRWQESSDGEAVIVDFGLSNEFMRPLRDFASFDVDPLTAIMAALSGTRSGELACVQILFQAVRNPWSESIIRAVTDHEGGDFFADAPEILPLAKQKVSRPLFAAVLRLAAKSPTSGRAWELVRAMSGGLARLTDPASNELIPLTNEEYPDAEHVADFLGRQTRRSGMLLNSDELVALVHLPSASVQIEKFAREAKKTRPAPRTVVGHALVLGENVHQGRLAPVSLAPEQRLRHMHVIGATGTGKSTLLCNLILQDIGAGNGVAVIDPHGDLIDEVLGRVPHGRRDDVMLFDPADTEFPVGLNLLSASSDLEKTLLASDLVAVFRRLSTSWGDQMNSLLGNAILAFLESSQGGTLLDLRRFLVDQGYRRDFLETVSDSEVRFYFEREFPLLGTKSVGAVLTRLDTFLRPKPVRAIVATQKSRLDFREILDGGRIFLGKLAQGLIGEENSYLLGALLVAKLHQAALSRQSLEAAKRRPFFIFIDEFQHFITPSLGSLLSGGRKYGVGLILAHQDLEQLFSRSPEVASEVLSNPSVRVCFRLGESDAKRVKDGFVSFAPQDFANLGIGEAIVRVERADHDFNLKVPMTEPVDAGLAAKRREALIALSRQKYATRVAAAERVHERAPEQEQQTRRETAPKPEPLLVQIGATLQPAREAPSRRTAPPSFEPAQMGRGGPEHKYLQSLIKRLAEDRGWRAIIERPVADGSGSVDVLLEREGITIGCEISVNSTPEQELGNIEKCLAAGFTYVSVIAADRRALERLRTKMQVKDARVRFFLPEEFLSFLDERSAEIQGAEKTVKGYRVKVRYRALDETEKKERSRIVSETVARAVARLKADR